MFAVAGMSIKSEWAWRLPCIVQILGPVMVMTMLIWAPESPRWLAKQGRIDEARAILVEHHANGSEHDDLVDWQCGEMLSALDAESRLSKSTYVSPRILRAVYYQGSYHPQLDFFKTPGNRKRFWINCLLGLASNWVGNGIIT